jgi:hypothetical protein
MSEITEAYKGGYCDRCYNTGQIDCYCGGDFCVCANQGEIDCPQCHGRCFDEGDEYPDDEDYQP